MSQPAFVDAPAGPVPLPLERRARVGEAGLVADPLRPPPAEHAQLD